jgi:hypothetical protein
MITTLGSLNLKSGRKAIVCVLIGVAVFSVFIVLALRKPAPPDFLQNPAQTAAAYTELLVATASVSGDPYSTDSGPKLAAFVAQNGKVYEAVERVLEKPAEAANYDGAKFDPMMFASVKAFGSTFLAKGRLAESEKGYGDAAKAYFDAMRLGEKIQHGPAINYLVGAATERSGIKRLETLIPKLSTNELRVWARKLQELNENRLSFEEILRRENYYIERNATNVLDLVRTRFGSHTRALMEKSRESHLNLRAQVEVLAATMGAVCYARENSKSVVDVAGLAPNYLSRTPIDPYVEGGLRVTTSTNGIVFYSVGKNRADEKGKGDDIALKHTDHTAMQVMMRALSGQ